MEPSQEPPHSQKSAYVEHKPLPLPKKVPNKSVTSYSHGKEHSDDAFVHEFTRHDLRELIHLITQELKLKGTKTPLLLLAFRPNVGDTQLSGFLETVLPTGTKLAKTSTIEHTVKTTDEYTLISALKYLWARLPTHSIVGWDAYRSFVLLERKEGYPKRAFLEHMPQCLSSPSHASIVYDFLDLIVSVAANVKENQMSGRKIAKMAAIWAFDGPSPEDMSSTKPIARTSETGPLHHNFANGLKTWLPAADAMFHLLLSFLRSMLPDDHSSRMKLPRTLHALLASNSYPPPDMTYSSSTLVSIPLVTFKTNRLSTTPLELLNRLPKYLNFNNADIFEAKEDYALLKSLCKTDGNIFNKLSDESKRIIQSLNVSNSQTRLVAGWPPHDQPSVRNDDVEINACLSRVPIDDYFIWAWMASISFEQPSSKRKMFGRSLILEVVFDGFKKWIIVEETDLDAELGNNSSILEKPKVKKTIQPQYTSMLDDVSTDTVQKKPKKIIKKTIPQVVESIPAIREPVPGKRKLSTGLLKRFHHKHAPLPLPPVAPEPVPKDPLPYSSSFSYEPLDLPEIEREQYRLSIPLDSFDLSELPSEYTHPIQQQQQQQQQQQKQYSSSPQDGQYKSLAPPTRKVVEAREIEQYNQDLNHWAQEDPDFPQGARYYRDQGNTYASDEHSRDHEQGPHDPSYQLHDSSFQPEDQTIKHHQEYQDHFDYPIENQRIPVPDPNPFQYDEPQPQRSSVTFNESMENLNHMVDDMTIKVNQVESKLGSPVRRKVYDERVSPPQQYQEPGPRLANNQSRPTSQIYEPYRSPRQLDQKILSSPSQSHSKPELSPIRTEQSNKPRRKPPTDAESISSSAAGLEAPPGPDSVVGGPSSSVYASSSVYDTLNSGVDGEFEEKRPTVEIGTTFQQRSMIDDVEHYISNSDSNPRGTVFSEATYTSAKSQVSKIDDEEEKMYSVQSDSISRYPGSIIDTYRQPSISQLSRKPSEGKLDTRYSSENSRDATPVVRGSDEASDTRRIPDSLVVAQNDSMPIPSPPRSPLVKRPPPSDPVERPISRNQKLNELPLPDLPPKVNGNPVPVSTHAPITEQDHHGARDGKPHERLRNDTYLQAPSPPVSSSTTSQEQRIDGNEIRHEVFGYSDQYLQPVAQNYDQRQQGQIKTAHGFARQQHQDQYGRKSPFGSVEESDRSSHSSQDQQQYRTQKIPQSKANYIDGGSHDNQVSYQQSPPPQLSDPIPSRLAKFEERSEPIPAGLQTPSQYPRQKSPHNIQRREAGRSPGPGPGLGPVAMHSQANSYPQQSTPPNLNSRQNRQQGYPNLQPHRNTPSPHRQQRYDPSRNGPPPSSNSSSSLPGQSYLTPQRNHRGRSPNNKPSSSSPSPGHDGNYPSVQGHYPPPKGHQPSPHGYPNYPPPPQGYQPPPQGYPLPPQGYPNYPPPPPQGYPPPPQGYPPPPQGYPPPPQGYPPPPQGYPWYPPYGYYPPAPGSLANSGSKEKSDQTLDILPNTNIMNHRNQKIDKKSIRNALVQGDFGI